MQRRIAPGAAAALLGIGLLGVILWWRKNPSACPYGLRFSLELPHPFLTRLRLREILAPKPGENVLEVGPGTGYHALHVARWLEPGGTLDVLDIQQEMLDHTMRRARELGVSNIIPTRGDARELPYPDDTFDGAYLNFVLGEVPDQEKTLRELRRVLRPGGRLVVGEAVLDPHMVGFDSLREKAETAGLRFEHRLGGALGYYARFAA
jgi:ubiquinone/menaquinone biosynthesis C-methylase UbiE